MADDENESSREQDSDQEVQKGISHVFEFTPTSLHRVFVADDENESSREQDSEQEVQKEKGKRRRLHGACDACRKRKSMCSGSLCPTID
jgi:hypothetical protein